MLVLDKATSALDSETEAAVISATAAMDQELTIVIVADRLTTVAHCENAIQLERGRIVGAGTFDRVVGDRARQTVGTKVG